MQLIRNIIDLFSLKRSAPSISPSGQEWLRGGTDDDFPGKLVAPYSQCAWVYVAISVLAETVAHVPFRISRGRGKGETLVESGPVYELFRNPHPSMSRALFWQTLVSWEALRGEFFVVPLDEAGQPVPVGRRNPAKPCQMMPLSPDCFAHLISGHQIVGWRFNGAEQQSPVQAQVLLPEEVIHWRNFNPYFFWRGLSPLSVAMLPASSDFAAAQFMKGLMINNGDAGLIVTTEEMLGDEQREQMRASLYDRKRRAGTADRPLFLWGKAKVEKPTISSADLQFLENRKLSRQEIGAIFKVPDSMMGFAGEKSALSAGSAIQQDRLTFIENTVGGLCRRLEAAMEPIIKSFDPMLYGWFDLDSLPIMQAARRDRMITAAKAFEMGVPFNELNQVYDLGFESLPWGNKGYVPATLIEVGSSSRKAAPTHCDTAPPQVDAIAERFLHLLEQSPSPTPEASDPFVQQSAKRKSGKLSRFLFEQRTRVLEHLEKRFLQNEPIFESFSEGPEPLKNNILQNEPICTGQPVLDLAEENATLCARLAPLLIDDFHHGAGANPVSSEAITRFLSETKTSLPTPNQQTIAQLTTILKDCVNAGEGFQELANRVKRLYRDLADEIDQLAMDQTLKAIQAGQALDAP